MELRTPVALHERQHPLPEQAAGKASDDDASSAVRGAPSPASSDDGLLAPSPALSTDVSATEPPCTLHIAASSDLDRQPSQPSPSPSPSPLRRRRVPRVPLTKPRPTPFAALASTPFEDEGEQGWESQLPLAATTRSALRSGCNSPDQCPFLCITL